MSYYADYIVEIDNALRGLKVTTLQNVEVHPEEGFRLWCDMTHRLKEANGTMFFAGNGASAMMSSHMAVDVCKNAGIRSMGFNDVAFLTAISNDVAYEKAFSLPLSRYANPGVILVTISSSGNSPNVIDVIAEARKMGVYVITLSGMKPDNRSRLSGDLNFYIPAGTYGFVESAHQVLLHCWFDMYMEACTK